MKHLKLLLLLFAASGFSQEVELKWAEKIKTKHEVTILGGKDGHYYTRHRNGDKELICRIYDKDLKLVNEKPLQINVDAKKKLYSGAYFLGDKIVHFITENIRKEDKDYLYGAITDLNLKADPNTYVLDEADDNSISFGLRSISPDSTKILVFNESKSRKKDPSLLNFKVYNATLTEAILDRSVSLPIKASKFSREAIEVDNFGNVYVLAKIYKEKEDKAKGQSEYSYKIFVFSKNDQKEFDFDFPDRDIESIGILPGENNTLVCTGFLKILNKGLFGSGKKRLISDELFSAVIDCKSLSLKTSNKLELEGLYPEKPRKTEDYVPYKVKDIFYDKDGGSVVVAEQYKLVVTTSYSPNGGTHTTYTYYYCDIACIHINAKSEVVSVSKMPKYQRNAGNPSILSTYYKGNTYVIYEDLEKNADAETDKETKRSSKGLFTSSSKNALFLLTIKPNGEMKKDVIYSYKESKIRPRVLTSVVAAKNEIILNADDQIGVLRFTN
ncbi:MAG: hypothetical protein CFE23_10065 [Flavobacterium sp. BFFFF1]|uniref:hypothetical protein n=1 Tax=unclassified Flavobacterium TaxID=196869 RepID=UPI000BC6F545|nr:MULTISPECIES: hypothetical protein [unclassified Flavobacterium]OYU80242.1 MAG: hypothetical protein CFE23_10065 [Flavobacterium sp. BFFFF1]